MQASDNQSSQQMAEDAAPAPDAGAASHSASVVAGPVGEVERADSTDVFLEETDSGAKERFEWSACTIQVALTIHPEDGQPGGRLITIAARSHRDAPVTRTLRRDELGSFPAPLRDLLVELKNALPERERLARERRRLEAEKAAKDEEAKRQTAARRDKASASAKAAVKGTKPAMPATSPAADAIQTAPTDTEGPAPQAGLFT